MTRSASGLRSTCVRGEGLAAVLLHVSKHVVRVQAAFSRVRASYNGMGLVRGGRVPGRGCLGSSVRSVCRVPDGVGFTW